MAAERVHYGSLEEQEKARLAAAAAGAGGGGGGGGATGSSAIEAAKRAGNINIAEEGKTEVGRWVGRWVGGWVGWVSE